MNDHVITHKGHTFLVEHERDDQSGPPWTESDGHGIVTDWTRNTDEYDAEPARYWVLTRDRWEARYYDVDATREKATKEGWGLSPDREAELIVTLGRQPEPADIIARAVELDYQYLRDWANDEWYWIGVIVKHRDFRGHTESVWGLQSSDDPYLRETAIELADQVLDALPALVSAEITRLQELAEMLRDE